MRTLITPPVPSNTPAITKPRTKNSYRNSAPIAVTLNLLWKHSDKAVNKLGHVRDIEEVKLRTYFKHLHEEVLNMDRGLKHAVRFMPTRAEENMRQLCEKIIRDLDTDGGFTPVVLRKFAAIIQPVRQTARGRLARMNITA